MKKVSLGLFILILGCYLCFSVAVADANIKVGDILTLGKYEQDNNTQNGKEAIEWIVLDVQDSKALIVSRYGLEAISYSKPMDVNEWIGIKVSWESSYIREWLNNDFYKKSFSADEQKRITLTSLSTSDAYGKVTTEDYVFCLNIDECQKYWKDSSEMTCSITKYAKTKVTNDGGTVDKNGNCSWWLRDLLCVVGKSSDENDAAYVFTDGGLSAAKNGNGVPTFCDYLVTVRPAMWISVSNAEASTAKKDEAKTYTTLNVGNSGNEVKELQKQLSTLGYYHGTADGKYDSKTEAAVKDFQTVNGLNDTGVANEKTQELLFSNKAKKALPTRKLNQKFETTGFNGTTFEVTINSYKFVTKCDVGGGYELNPSDGGFYLVVEAIVKNTSGQAIKSNLFLGINAEWNGETYYGTKWPADKTGYSAVGWFLSGETISSGTTKNMIYAIELPKGAKGSSVLCLSFLDGTKLKDIK